MPQVRRFDHVGLTVADLDVVTAFFVALGLEVEGTTFVEGEFIDTVCRIPDSRTEIVMLKPPGDSARLEFSSFVRPDSVPGSPAAMASEQDCAAWPSRSATCRRLSTGQLPKSYGLVGGILASTRALGGWPTSACRKGSSYRWPIASAEPRNARICRRPGGLQPGRVAPGTVDLTRPAVSARGTASLVPRPAHAGVTTVRRCHPRRRTGRSARRQAASPAGPRPAKLPPRRDLRRWQPPGRSGS